MLLKDFVSQGDIFGEPGRHSVSQEDSLRVRKTNFESER